MNAHKIPVRSRKWLSARCTKCNGQFTYQPAQTIQGQPRRRHICDPCRRSREKFLKKTWKKRVRAPLRNRRANEPRAVPSDGYAMTLLEIGKRLGMDTSTVELVQRQALAKMRASPELRAAFDQYVEAGLPRIKELLAGVRSDREQSRRLLELQMQVGDLWRIYEELKRQVEQMDEAPAAVRELPLWRQSGRRLAASLRSELQEMMQEIDRFQDRLRREMEGK